MKLKPIFLEMLKNAVINIVGCFRESDQCTYNYKLNYSLHLAYKSAKKQLVSDIIKYSTNYNYGLAVKTWKIVTVALQI